LAIFRTENHSQIVGGKVLDGEIRNNSLLEVYRGDAFITPGKITKLQSGKQDVNSVDKDEEAGLLYEGRPIIEVGDILVNYIEERIEGQI